MGLIIVLILVLFAMRLNCTIVWKKKLVLVLVVSGAGIIVLMSACNVLKKALGVVVLKEIALHLKKSGVVTL